MSNKEKQKTYYDEKSKGGTYWTEGLPMPHFYPNKYVFDKLLCNVTGKHVVDFGCGCGQFSYYLSKKGARVTAFDISKKNICDLNTFAKEYNVFIPSLVASADQCPLEAESFDFVFGSAILHHLELDEEKDAVRESYRMLKKGGMAIFIEPLINSKLLDTIREYIPIKDKYNPRPSKFSAEFRKYAAEDPHPVRPLTSAHFKKVFSDSGFKVQIKEIGIFNRLDRLTRNQTIRKWISTSDYYFLQYLVPFRGKFYRNIVVIAEKEECG